MKHHTNEGNEDEAQEEINDAQNQCAAERIRKACHLIHPLYLLVRLTDEKETGPFFCLVENRFL